MENGARAPSPNPPGQMSQIGPCAGGNPDDRPERSAASGLERRFFLGTAAAGLLVTPARAQHHLMVIYVSADDCAPCIVFSKQDFPQWQASPLSRRVRFVTAHAPKSSQAFQARFWPSEARPFLGAVKTPIVPTFILVQSGTVSIVGAGLAGWRNQILPQVQRLAT